MHRMNARSWLTALLMSATLVLAIVPSVAAAKPEAYSCSLFPGTTTLSWRGDKDTTSISIQWLVGSEPIFDPYTVIIFNGKPEFSIGTPLGATGAQFTYYDSLGGVETFTDTCV